jgi:hypothetical protein
MTCTFMNKRYVILLDAVLVIVRVTMEDNIVTKESFEWTGKISH